MRPAVALEDGLVVVRTVKCTLVLTAEEIAGLVHFDRETWIRALKRGKAFRRGEAMARRTNGYTPTQPTEDEAYSTEPLTSSQLGQEPG